MRILLIMIAGILAACAPATDPAERAGVVLTIHGDIAASNCAAMDPQTEPLFNTFGLEFEQAYAVSAAQLASLAQHDIQVDYPAGGAQRAFRGPLLRDVLALAMPRGDNVVVTALDGYQRDISWQRIEAHDVILATSMDGQPLPMGGFGPAMLVWPRATDRALAGMSDDDWLWGVIAIEITTSP